MIRIKEAIVVEGKYDRIRLVPAVDTVIVETAGFGIFKDAERLGLVRLLAEKRGLLILTDSDSAGFVIRNYLTGVIPREQIKQAYCPETLGKERRKSAPSKEGLLGVEGIDAELLILALRRAGATFLDEGSPTDNGFTLTKARLYEDGLTGGPDSGARRKELLRKLGLPEKLSSNRLCEVVSATLNEDEYKDLL